MMAPLHSRNLNLLLSCEDIGLSCLNKMTSNALQCVLFSCCRNDAADGYAAGLQASGNDHKIDVFRAFRTNMLEKRVECMEPRSLWPEVADTIVDPAIPYQDMDRCTFYTTE